MTKIPNDGCHLPLLFGPRAIQEKVDLNHLWMCEAERDDDDRIENCSDRKNSKQKKKENIYVLENKRLDNLLRAAKQHGNKKAKKV